VRGGVYCWTAGVHFYRVWGEGFEGGDERGLGVIEFKGGRRGESVGEN